MRRLTATVLVSGLAWVTTGAVPVKVPLCPGLTIVTAIAQREGDYESLKTIESVSGGIVRIKYSTERVLRDRPGQPIQKLQLTRTARINDIRSSDKYLQEFTTSLPVDVPGTTALGISSAVLATLKAKGAAGLTMFDLPPALPGEKPYSTDTAQHPNIFDHEIRFNLRRAGTEAVTLPVLVNGVPTDLPAIHASGSSEWGEKGDFFFLDDEANPLALQWRIRTSNTSDSDRASLQVIKLSFNCTATALDEPTPLERALADKKKVDVYSIYFSFNSDELRPESDPTLKELGELLRRHPDWKLDIGGHTDGVGGDAFNLDLSKRRAAAVKQALVTRFQADPARLATDGYGKSQPRDTNDTAEGRARNRRVELIRE